MPVVTQWLRPEEFCNIPRPGEAPLTAYRQPTFYKSMWEIEGIIQGAGMDNRWFISALNIVASNRGQLDRVFFGELDPTWVAYGFFVCKFYQDDPLSDDDWQVVLIDDRIPVGSDARPAFCRNPDPNIYWAIIIEKAYAKFAGSYEAMQGGTVVQGLEDLTGGIGYKFDLEKREKEWIPPKGSDPDRLWSEIMEKFATEHVIGCANNTKGQERPQTTKMGLLLNRAYAIVTGGEFEDNRLMRLRVPLNEDGTALEWNGKWSDDSKQWNNRLRQMLAYGSDSEDGCFWMAYKDLCRHFNKVYMCRMLDDLWTRVAVRSRWMDETAGGCTNFISWRNNNQWLLTITRPNTKMVIKLSQPDARKSAGNGRHYSNAIGFYILKGNAPNASRDEKRRKLICIDGDEEDGGDFVFCKGPRFSKQVLAEYTFEKASTTPYILMPFIFEPGRESLFKFTLLSDDRDDDGEPDFYFQNVKPEEDWIRLTIKDAWHKGGKGNQFVKYNLPFQGDKAHASID
uniref:Calpain catalytic domain-containing protein n=1 Tax=Haptolina brevifila TaxID=156173 RepID=A0A7S2NM39_9EUKA